MSATATQHAFLAELGLEDTNAGTWIGRQTHSSGEMITSKSPVDGAVIGKVSVTTREQYDATVAAATEAFKVWRKTPAPLRGEIVRQYGNKLREHKDALGRLVSYEMGKSLQEGWGESGFQTPALNARSETVIHFRRARIAFGGHYAN